MLPNAMNIQLMTVTERGRLSMANQCGADSKIHRAGATALDQPCQAQEQPLVQRFVWMRFDFLPERDPMTVRSSNGKFSHPPRFVSRLLDSRYAIPQKLEIQIVNGIDGHICEVRVIACLICR